MWGGSIWFWQMADGREGDWFLAGFSPRKQNLTLYIMSGFKFGINGSVNIKPVNQGY